MAHQNCYDRSGQVKDGWQPCNPKDSVSTCCGGTDLCMSNGLCLNAGGNQAYTIQGCTNKDWSAPCNFFCELDDPSDNSGMYYLQYCWNTDPTSDTATQWCCGHDCCSDSSKVHNLTLAKQIYSPGKASAVATITATTMLTLSSGATAPVEGITSPTNVSYAAVVSKQQYDNTVIGLSVPFAILAILAFVALVLWYFRALPPVITRRRRETEPPRHEIMDNSGNNMAYGAHVMGTTQGTSSGANPLHTIDSSHTGPKSPETMMSEMEEQNRHHELPSTLHDSGHYKADNGHMIISGDEQAWDSWSPGDDISKTRSH